MLNTELSPFPYLTLINYERGCNISVLYALLSLSESLMVEKLSILAW